MNIAAIVFVLVLAAVYFVPAIVALNRRHQNAGAIAVLDLLLGWTLLGWVAALVWAMTDNVRQEVSSPGGEVSRFRWGNELRAVATTLAAGLAIVAIVVTVLVLTRH